MKGSLKYKIIIVSIFVVLMLTLAIVQTYALFETNASGTKNMGIGEWNILLNNANVVTTRTITLNDFTYVNGEHTDANHFAPGSSAYFELTIDASNCDVSVAYDLTIDDSAIEDYPNIYFSITDVSSNTTLTTNNYSGIIPLSAANRTRTLRFTLIWTNSSTYDESDTSLIGENLAFSVDAVFEQYTGE